MAVSTLMLIVKFYCCTILKRSNFFRYYEYIQLTVLRAVPSFESLYIFELKAAVLVSVKSKKN